MALRVVMLGGPGAGKGTQAMRIADTFGAPHISTGDLFREHIEKGTEIGKQVQACISAGGLAPDELTWRIVEERLSRPDCEDGYILDGFPRTRAQAEALQQDAERTNRPITVVLDLRVDDNEVVRRLSARRSCAACGAVYNLKFAPPKNNTCDRCGGPLTQRADDREETIRERLRVYHKMACPVEDFFAREGLLRIIDGTGRTPDEVFATIEETLDTIGVERAG